MVTPNKGRILELILNEQWENLCEYLRTWLNIHCPKYRQNEREVIIQTWVCRMVVVKFQADESSYFGVYSQVQKEDMLHEINTKWDNVYKIYQYKMQQIANVEPAEVEVKNTVERIRSRKQAK